MKFSVVTISFNQAPFLRQCIESVLSQKGVDLDYIVVDPGSTDGSREIIAEYGSAIRTVLQRDNGPADGLNLGFKEAIGDVFCFINSDDFFYPGALNRVLRYMQEEPVDLLFGAGFIVDKLGNKTRRVVPSKMSARAYANGAVTLLQQGMFFTRKFYEMVGGFNNANRTCWDGELVLQGLLKGASIKRVPDIFGAFRIYPQSITGSQRFAHAYAGDQDRLRRMVYADGAATLGDAMYYRTMKLIDPWYLALRFYACVESLWLRQQG